MVNQNSMSHLPGYVQSFIERFTLKSFLKAADVSVVISCTWACMHDWVFVLLGKQFFV